MLYVSKNKVKNIIKFHKKGLMEKWRVCLPASVMIKGPVKLKFHFKHQDSLQIAIQILKRDGEYYEHISKPIKTGIYYIVIGKMRYINRIDGITRCRLSNKAVKKLKNDEFLKDDILVFEIRTKDTLSYEKLKINCKADNMECFSMEKIHGTEIYTSNTMDPGVLHKEVLVEGLIRIDESVDKNGIMYGSPLYIKMKMAE